MDQFLDAMENGTRILICSTPLAWLRAGCEGYCPLDLAEDFHEADRMRSRLAGLEAA